MTKFLFLHDQSYNKGKIKIFFLHDQLNNKKIKNVNKMMMMGELLKFWINYTLVSYFMERFHSGTLFFQK